MSSLIVRRRLRARRQHRSRHLLRIFLILGLGVVAIAAAGATAAIAAVFAVYQHYAQDYLPIEDHLRQRNVGLTEIYDRGGPDGGILLGSLANPEAQLLNPVPLDRISEWMVEATVSTEDDTFYDNPGVNVRGLLRAFYENYIAGTFGSGSGGSSITQQLVKNVYICPQVRTAQDQYLCVTAERTLDRKLREIVYALELTKDYTKDQILAWYLNQISYAGQYIGVQAAAQGYFRKDAADLTLGEAAVLAGIPAAPTRYHPRLNCIRDGSGLCVADAQGATTLAEDAKARQEHVLSLMVQHGWITQQQADAAASEVIRVYPALNPVRASAFIYDQVEPRLVRMCEAGWLERESDDVDCNTSVHTAGYKVTTTLDWELTVEATAMIDEFIQAGLKNGCGCYNGALITIDPRTGEIPVYAPNRDPNNTADPRIAGNIDQLTEINQPGSAFKPAVYLAWFDHLGKAPMSALWDTSPLNIEGVVNIVNPRSGELKSEGLVSARAGLGGSQNVPAFRAAGEAGVDNVIAMAKALGITTLQQHFDPTWRSHQDVTYGQSIATGGANIRAIDMAYMGATIANVGIMVGVPHLARTLDPDSLQSFAFATGSDYDEAKRQFLDFAKGNTRLPGTRGLDPIVIREVRDIDGRVIFRQGDPERSQVVDAGSVWLLQSIMTDCTARFIIWHCGNSNSDLGLDFFMSDGQRVPSGIKTGTQQGPLSAADTLETWMTGYTRYAATAVWVGNANNELVRDGLSADFATAKTTTTLWKTWMGAYHDHLQAEGIFQSPEGFSDLQPANVTFGPFKTVSTDSVLGLDGDYSHICEQMVDAWMRTDVEYEDECEDAEIDVRNGLLASSQTPAQFREKRMFVKLPALKPDLAEELAAKMGIPIAPTESSSGEAAVTILVPTNGKTLRADTPVVGRITVSKFKEWRLEYGESSNPAEWTIISQGEEPPTTQVLGLFEIGGLENGVYTIRLVVETPSGALSTSVTFNVRKETSPEGTPGTTPGPGSGPGTTPSPGGGPGSTPLPGGTPVPTSRRGHSRATGH